MWDWLGSAWDAVSGWGDDVVDWGSDLFGGGAEGIGPVADGAQYGDWLEDTAGTTGVGPWSSGDAYGEVLESDGLFDGLGGFGASSSIPGTKDTGGFNWEKLASQALGGLVAGAPGILGAKNQQDLLKAKQAEDARNERLRAMVELAKLKYGAKGGGGGGGGNANAQAQMRINALLAGSKAKSDAAQALGSSVAAAFGR